ncbi:MAG: cupin domain-containing protein [Acetobacteraceae bacterium]
MSMRVLAGNLLDTPADAHAGERITSLVASAGALVERVVSAGQASPAGFWYDQDRTEFVVLLAGTASLRIEAEAAARDLQAGDYLVLPTHCRHRVERTSSTPPAVWLAVHLG